jgi:hypothetical protein
MFALALVLAAAAPSGASAKGDKKATPAKADKGDESEDDDATTSDDSDDESDAGAAKKKPAKKDDDAKVSDDEDDSGKRPANTLPAKQDLTGHDLGATKKANEFERDRFFVDKVDSVATERGTLVQGSLTSTSFAYTESGGSYGGMQGGNAASFSRLFTDLRLQTDFRHIAASRWEARIDARLRMVDTPPSTTFDAAATGTGAVTATHIQSGLTGQNEYDLRELWLIRNGVRTDIILGRQYITDLAAIKIDGLRVDYASSSKFTLLGFGGLYPLRGSRSVTTDYVDLRDSTGNKVGNLVVATGGGAAYRTELAYGSFGGVVLAPAQGEKPRVFGTSTGYWRLGSTLDLYHFAVVDLVGNNDALGAGSAGLTNLSVGANFKPIPRLRATASFNRVDTDTLNVQAYAFLTQPTGTTNTINNELYVTRLATSEMRGSLSAGLGELQRFEITMALSYRTRPDFKLTAPDGVTTASLPAASSVEVYGSITDRRSVADMRLGVDFVRTYDVNPVAFSRSNVLAVRAFAARELASGKGEWETEVTYASTKDANVGYDCSDISKCYGATDGTILSAGGTLYYRFDRDWLGIASAYVSQTALKQMGQPADPSILGLTGFGRIAYRF